MEKPTVDITNQVLLERPRLQVDDTPNIKSIGYDPEMWMIIVEYPDGKITGYAPFDQNKWEYFQSALNKWAYMTKFILSNPKVEIRKIYENKNETNGNDTEQPDKPLKNSGL